jgi:hypothetical protein
VTLEECEEATGLNVVYTGGHVREEGVLTEVRGPWAFVRFGEDQTAKACQPDQLTLVFRSASIWKAGG